MFEYVKVGDTITRMLAGSLPMALKVTEVTETEILCGPRDVGYMFDRKHGAEIDGDLDWGPPPKMTGSYLRKDTPEPKDEHIQSTKK